jgi:glutamate/tyrosine decarboxylase-like PLP-dependent enzyme
MIDKREIDILREALDVLSAGFDGLPDYTPVFDDNAVSDVLREVAIRMRDNYPYFHPRYAGQMLKPPHTVARLAYALSLWINPNNHALDGGRASSEMEKECIRDLGAIFGWEQPLGHLAGGGTMANLEALWVAGRLRPAKRVIASSQAHYTHNRICDVLGIPFTAIRDTDDGQLDLAHAEELLAEGDVGTIVATIGNTGFGDVDPLADILTLRDRYDVRIHADAAYGGYFGLSSRLDAPERRTYDKLSEVDSIVIDPHKHGLQPYGCGCVLFCDPADGRFYQHDSPYTYFSSAELHLGEISLECSRPGASAVALWATHRLLPPVRGGEFATGLDHCLEAARSFYDRLSDSASFRPLTSPALDIVVYAVDAPDTKESASHARRVFELAAKEDLHLAMIELPSQLVRYYAPGMRLASETTTCLRSVLMKPEHRDWLESIMETLEKAATRSRES